ncbi:MAG: hypothetical protein ACOYOS_16825 [Syntrophales bacterium]
MAFASWFLIDGEDFYETEDMSRRTFLSPSGETAIEIVTDAAEMLAYYVQHNESVDVAGPPDATVIYSLDEKACVRDTFGVRLLRRPPAVDFCDAAIDLAKRRVLIAGVRHYGLLKSIVAGISSLVMASDVRQGLHAGAFAVDGRGILLAGGAEAGKTALFLRLLGHVTGVATEDWCDVCLTEDGVVAVGLETNLSVNTADLPELVKQKLLPSSVLTLDPIPHGHRDKIVLPLSDICGANMCLKLPINDIFVICDVNEPQVVRHLTGEALDEMFSTISMHLPLCTQFKSRFDRSEDADLGEGIANCEQLERAAMVTTNRRTFCNRLAAHISKGGCGLCLLPARRNAGSLAKAVDLILGGVSV